MELAIPIAVVAIVLLIPTIFLLMRMLKTTGELRQLDADLAAKMQELEHTKAQLASADEDSSAAQELRIEVAALQQQLNDKTELLARADASVEDLETKRVEIQSEVAKLGRSEAQLTEELKNERAALDGTKESLESAENERDQYRTQLEQTRIREGKVNAELTTTKEQLVEREELLKQAKESFKVLSTETLEQQQKAFMESADANLKERQEAVEKIVKPLSESIDKLDKARVASNSKFEEQIKALAQSKDHLAEQASKLSSALQHKPQVRGQWGEMQVERALELGGLVKGKHYFPQSTTSDGLHPDFIVKMPHERDLVIDSKVPLNAYLEAEAAETDDARDDALDRHANAVRNFAEKLGRKAYQDNLESSIDYTVMVVPEFALAPAEQRDNDLIVRALRRKVLITTHSNLVALVSTVALGWKERTVYEKAQDIAELGVELHDRLTVYAGHVHGVGTALSQAVNRYNESIGSFERNVLTSANRFPKLGVLVTKEMPSANIVDASIRPLTKIEPTAIDTGNGNGYDSET